MLVLLAVASQYAFAYLLALSWNEGVPSYAVEHYVLADEYRTGKGAAHLASGLKDKVGVGVGLVFQVGAIASAAWILLSGLLPIGFPREARRLWTPWWLIFFAAGFCSIGYAYYYVLHDQRFDDIAVLWIAGVYFLVYVVMYWLLAGLVFSPRVARTVVPGARYLPIPWV